MKNIWPLEALFDLLSGVLLTCCVVAYGDDSVYDLNLDKNFKIEPDGCTWIKSMATFDELNKILEFDVSEMDEDVCGAKGVVIKNLTIASGYTMKIKTINTFDGNRIIQINSAQIKGKLYAEDIGSNYTTEINGDMTIYGEVDFTNLNINVVKQHKLTVCDGARINFGSGVYSNDIDTTIDLSNCGDKTILEGIIAKGSNTTIILPKEKLHGDTNATGNSDGKYIGELPISVADNKITVSESAVQCGIKIFGTDDPIENLLKMNISQIAAAEEEYNKENILDVTQDRVDPIITADKTDINFTVLTTPSTGINIDNGAAIMTPISIRLKLD